LEILNEPANNSHLQKFYDTTLSEIRQVAPPDFPIYLSDAWDTAHYAKYVGARDDFVVLDHHLYRCFTDEDSSMNGDSHARKLREEFERPFAEQGADAGGNMVVGEWSASLSDRGLGGVDNGEKDRQRREFVKAQLELFDSHTGGWWFWTYKKGDGWDAGWCARDAARAEILPAFVGLTWFKGVPAAGAKERGLQKCHSESINSVSLTVRPARGLLAESWRSTKS
jgi:glucan 1,3-beta-glucosidase